jgi:hypothetical protein
VTGVWIFADTSVVARVTTPRAGFDIPGDAGLGDVSVGDTSEACQVLVSIRSQKRPNIYQKRPNIYQKRPTSSSIPECFGDDLEDSNRAHMRSSSDHPSSFVCCRVDALFENSVVAVLRERWENSATGIGCAVSCDNCALVWRLQVCAVCRVGAGDRCENSVTGVSSGDPCRFENCVVGVGGASALWEKTVACKFCVEECVLFENSVVGVFGVSVLFEKTGRNSP